MKKISLFFVINLFLLISCGGNSETPCETAVSAMISARSGGVLATEDGSAQIEIPAGAISLDTEIKMTLSDSSLYPKSDSIPTKVVSLEPHGTIFKKPVVITLKTEQKISFRLVSAAVWDEQADKWRYSREGAFAVYGKSDSGDPIMTNAMGDPIMLDADGDFIYKDSSGDPIMLTSMGDPIMLSKSEDPVKNAAMGDPIMLATGHFSTFTFILVDNSEYEASQKCKELFKCVLNCKDSDSKCEERCLAYSTDAGTELYNSLMNCSAEHCQGQSSGEVIFDMHGCMAENCRDELSECAAGDLNW